MLLGRYIQKGLIFCVSQNYLLIYLCGVVPVGIDAPGAGPQGAHALKAGRSDE